MSVVAGPTSSIKNETVSGSQADETFSDLPQIPIFGLSEYAVSGMN